MPALGVGITYSSVIEPLIHQRPQLFDVVEIEPQMLWLQTGKPKQPYLMPDSTLRRIASLPGRKLIHSVGTPVGGGMRPEAEQLVLLKQMIDQLESPWASDHLSFNSTPEFKTGFFLPPRQSEEAIEKIVQSIDDLYQGLGTPIAVETGVNYLRPRHDELPDGIFTARVAEQANCGILLDLHNIFANELNGRQSMKEFLAQIPLERVWEVHIAGGMEVEGFWLDAHSGAIAEPLIEIARKVLPTLPNLKAIIFEIFPAFVEYVGLDTIAAQIERLHELWDNRKTPTNANYGTLPVRKAGVSEGSGAEVTAGEWESTLGALVIGQTREGMLADELSADPGVYLINRLVTQFRGSMVVSVLPLTCRMMMLTLGEDVFRAILEDFWKQTPPKLFASEEAKSFVDYLIKLDIPLPKLKGIIAYERAVVETLLDDETRVVTFDFDPMPLLRALAQRRLPEIDGALGDYEIEITGDATEPNMTSNVFPFH